MIYNLNKPFSKILFLKIIFIFFLFSVFGSCLVMIKIPKYLELDGIVSCIEKEKFCTFKTVVSAYFNIQLDTKTKIIFTEEERILKVSYDEPSYLNNQIVNVVTLTVSKKQVKNNQVLKARIKQSEESLLKLLLKTWKGGDANVK